MVKLLFIVVGGKLFDIKGRRPLLFISLIGMAIALLMISITFFIASSTSSGFIIFGLGMYLAAFSVGMGPGAWLVPAEVFPTSIRAKAMSLSAFLNRATATLMASTFLSTANAIGWGGFFLLLSIISLLVLGFLWIYLPETKGRSLEDMSTYFAEITGDNSILEAEVRISEARDPAVELSILKKSQRTTDREVI
jgi:MFS family permease